MRAASWRIMTKTKGMAPVTTTACSASTDPVNMSAAPKAPSTTPQRIFYVWGGRDRLER